MSEARSTQLLESIDQGLVYQFLNEASTYPYAPAIPLKGLSVNNMSTSDELTVTLTFIDDTTIAIPVPATTVYNGRFEKYKSLSATGATPFDIEVRR
jgi:hypothetical protein